MSDTWKSVGIIALIAGIGYFAYRWSTGTGILGEITACPAGQMKMSADCAKNYSGIFQTLCNASAAAAGNPCVTDFSFVEPGTVAPLTCITGFHKNAAGTACEQDPVICGANMHQVQGHCEPNIIEILPVAPNDPDPLPDPVQVVSCNELGLKARAQGCATSQEMDWFKENCLSGDLLRTSFPVCNATGIDDTCFGGAVLWQCPSGWHIDHPMSGNRSCCHPPTW